MDAQDKNSGPEIVEYTVVASPLDERSNGDYAVAVNRGIAAALLGGVSEGLKVMTAAGVPKNICLRVLNSKTRRRASDWR